jgi:zinc protease
MQHLSKRVRPCLAAPLLLLVWLCPIEPSAAGDQPAPPDPVEQAINALYRDIRTETLANGLRVYLKPVAGAPTVSTMLAYQVGSADEELDQTGLSHYLEHLLFKGTDKLMPGDIDRITQRHGGRNNAYTSEDMTVYHFDFAAEVWEQALIIEADRMRNTRIDEKHEFAIEKGNVISELEGNEDTPWDLEYKALLPLVFGKDAPYGHPVIGIREHVRDATAAIIQKHYDRWYHPNNAALVVVGGFDADRALARIRELFGPIPAQKLPARKTAQPVTRKQPVKQVLPSRFEVPRMLMAFNTVKQTDPEYHVFEVIEQVLAGGRTSRLYRALVEEQRLADAVGNFSHTGRYPGMFVINLELARGKTPDEAEQAVVAQLRKLADEPITPEELKRAQRLITVAAITAHEDVHNLADSIAQAVTISDLSFLQNYLPKIKAVTAEQVQAVAKRFLDPQTRVTVWSIPPGLKHQDKVNSKAKALALPLSLPHPSSAGLGASAGMDLAAGAGAGRGTASSSGTALARPARLARMQAGKPAPPANTPIGPAALQRTKRVVLPNGLTLLMLENRRLPLFVAQAYVKDAYLREPADKPGLARLVGELLDEGTTKRSGTAIATTLADLGGQMQFGTSGGSVAVLSSDRRIGLDLLLDCLKNPAFPAEALKRKVDQQLALIEDSERQPQTVAARLFQSVVYGKTHPLGRPPLGTTASVRKLSRDDCLAYHRAVFVPNNLILAVVGDFDAATIEAEVAALTKQWQRAELPPLQLPDPPQPKQRSELIQTMPESSQTYLYLGHLGIPRKHPDYYKLKVMENILGTGPGFTDRLSSILRDRMGLAYTVNATITANASELPGTFVGYIGTANDKYLLAKQTFLREIENFLKQEPTKQEVDDAKQYILGSLAFRFSTNQQLADQLVAIERFGLGLDYLTEYRQSVAAVTPADVLAVARKYLHPDKLALVAVGAIDAKGQPLKAPSQPQKN